MEPAVGALLCAVAFATAMLSAILGMAGGITLLAVMLLFLPPLVAIPLHGAIQLVSNASRVFAQRRHARFDILWRTGLLAVPMGILGLQVARSVPEAALEAAIGVFVLVATWAPGLLQLGAHPERLAPGSAKPGDPSRPALPTRRFVLLGGATGFLNVTVGATGALVAPFFLGLGLSRQAIIGTQAAVQALGHLVKIGLYGGFGFSFTPWLGFVAAASACAMAGTWVGTHVLERVTERAFTLLYKTVLTLIALHLALGRLL